MALHGVDVESEPVVAVVGVDFLEGLDVLRAVGQDVEAERGEADSEEPLNEEDPLPAFQVADAVHLLDGRCEETGEGTGQCGSREEERNADLQFVRAIEARQVKDNAGGKTAFAKTEEEATSKKAGVVVDLALKRRHNSPAQHHPWKQEPRPYFLKDKVGRQLGGDVWHISDGDG